MARGSPNLHGSAPDRSRVVMLIIDMINDMEFEGGDEMFEHALPEPLRDGLTHAVFEVKDVDAALKELVLQGTEVLIAPMEVDAAFGSRRLAFCRSPGGVVFEVMQIHINRL